MTDQEKTIDTIKIINIDELFKLNIVIPNYQRPYKWKEFHVSQLLNDLYLHFTEQRNHQYRIGTVITHNEEGKYNIVDGQQRITTLSLLLYALDEMDNTNSDSSKSYMKYIESQNFQHSISQKNILNNYQKIQNFLNLKDKEKLKGENNLKGEDKPKGFKNYILENCEVVFIHLDKLDEAFQFFDSQNARGKTLEAYDLLKAFHLREFTKGDDDIKQCVKDWEDAVEPENNMPNLDLTISKLLFRIRRWQEQEQGMYFDGTKINFFKGINLEDLDKYPYLSALKFSLLNKKDFNQINQPIINGKPFFNYIEYYRHLYYKVMKNNHITFHNKNNGKEENLISYLESNAYRVGDQYLLNLFKYTLLFYIDKFGFNQLDEVKKVIFYWVYKLRLIQYSIRYETIDNHAKNKEGLIYKIYKANSPNEFLDYTIASVENNFKNAQYVNDLFLFLLNKEVK